MDSSFVVAPGGWRRLAVIGGIVGLLITLSPLIVYSLGLPGIARWVIGIATFFGGVGFFVILRRRDFAPLHRRRREVQTARPDAEVVAITLDPLWTPVGAVGEDEVLPLTYGLAVADGSTLTLLDGSGTRLVAPWTSITELRPGRDGLEFEVDGSSWAFSTAPFQPRSGVRALRQLGVHARADRRSTPDG